MAGLKPQENSFERKNDDFGHIKKREYLFGQFCKVFGEESGLQQ